MESIDIFPIDWVGGDVDNAYVITCIGKTQSGESVSLNIEFYPYFFVALPPGITEREAFRARDEYLDKTRALKKYTTVVRRKSIWGFTNGRQRLFVQLGFGTKRDMYSARDSVKKKRETYESKIDPLIRFFHIREILPGQWIRVSAFRPCKTKRSRCDLEFDVAFGNVSPSPIRDVPPLVFACFDIECISGTGEFPVAHNPEDPIIQIGTTFKKYGRPPHRRTVVTLGSPKHSDDIDVIPCASEEGLIEKWIDLVSEESCDVLLTYNGDKFDWKYISDRADLSSSGVCLERLGRMNHGGGEVNERNTSSGAYGDHTSFTLTTPGILQVDMLVYIRKEYKLDGYALKDVASHFLPEHDGKIDLPAHKMFELYERGAPEDILLIA